MRVCYLLQTHGAPAQIVRLVHTIKRSSPNARVFVVHDATQYALDPAPFAALESVTVLNRAVPVRRGDMSMLGPFFSALERLCAEPDWEWLVYLSGQDYPVRPLPEIEAGLASSPYDGLMRYWDAFTGSGGPWGPRRGRRRYFCQYRRLAEWTWPWLWRLHWLEKVTPARFYLQYGPYLGWPSRATPFNTEFRCWGGISFYSLRRPAVEYLVAAQSKQAALFRYYEGTVSPEESLVQTLLVNSGRFRFTHDDRRYVNYTDSRDGRPHLLDMTYYPAITSDAYDFARKFDIAHDTIVLDRLDQIIFGADGDAAQGRNKEL